MDIDPMESLPDDEEKASNARDESEKKKERDKSRLNALVAITVALLATFMGICHVKDDNIVQAMQQAQADKIDNYAWYQARNIREEFGRVATAQLRAERAAAPESAKAEFDKQIAVCVALEKEQAEKKKEQQAAAEKADADYNHLNLHDDQFDLSDALLALSVSLLAMTALTQKRWLYVIALVPIFFGVLYGLAGVCGWTAPFFHPDSIMKLLS